MKIGIVGLGLMGGSFGRMLVKRTDNEVYGYDISESVLEKAEMLKAFDKRLTEENACELDMLIAAVPPEKFRSATERFMPLLQKGALVTDFCGTKRKVTGIMKECAERYEDLIFVGGHPMAGREVGGIERSLVTLFDGASMVLVNVNADIFKLSELKSFYLSLGFKTVEITTAEEHDDRIAFTSQLCHIVSNAYIKNENAVKHDGFSAGSYKDLTRVARLDSQLWTSLMSENADNLSKELEQLINHLKEYKDALDRKDREKLNRLLKEGNDRKIAIDVKSAKKE